MHKIALHIQKRKFIFDILKQTLNTLSENDKKLLDFHHTVFSTLNTLCT